MHFLPRDKVYIPDLEVNATVVSTIITADGIEYRVRYFKDGSPYETYLFDFELAKREVNVR